MKKSTLVLICTAIITSACAGAKLKSEWSEKRGYPDADVSAIMDQYSEYNRRLAIANGSSNSFNTAPIQGEQSSLRNVFCSCVKKMGPKCRQKEGAEVDRQLWIKANAVDLAFSAQTAGLTSAISFSPVDEAECGN